MKNPETERLIFKLYDESTFEDFVSLFTDDAVMRYVDRGVLSEAAARALWQKLTHEFYPSGIKTIWAVISKRDSRFIANASIRPRPENKNEVELGYVLPKTEWGNGYATEIAQKLIEIGFDDLKLDAVYATVDTDNEASIKVLEKCGMKMVRSEYDDLGKFYVYKVNKIKQ